MTNRQLHPIVLLSVSWGMMLMAYSTGISYLFTPLHGIVLPLCELIAVAFSGFVLGGAVVRVSTRGWAASNLPLREVMRPLRGAAAASRRRQLVLTCYAICGVLTLLNALTFGYPPLVSQLPGLASRYTYFSYGHLKGVLFGGCLVLMLLSALESKANRRWMQLLVAHSLLLLYTARAMIIIGWIQLFVLHLVVTPPDRRLRFLLKWGGVGIISVGLLMAAVGSIRTGDNAFREAMLVRDQYRNWPGPVIWVVTYVGAGLANLVGLLRAYDGPNFAGLATLCQLTPALLVKHVGYAARFSELYKELVVPVLPSANNTVTTYIGHAYLDGRYIGVGAASVAFGAVAEVPYRLLNRGHALGVLLFPIVGAATLLAFFDNIFALRPLWLEGLALAILVRSRVPLERERR